MKGLDVFACLSDLDLDLIEESAALFDPPATERPRGRILSGLSGFLSGGWGVAAVCAVVSVGLLAGMVWAGRLAGQSVTPPVGTPSESTNEEFNSGESASNEAVSGEAVSDEAASDEAATEAGVTHPDVVEGGVLFLSNGDGTCRIKGADKTWQGGITVPEVSPYGDMVTTVATGAFKGFRTLESVELPQTVTMIKGNAFQGCSVLRSVTLPREVREFGRSVFDGCGELRSVVLPMGVTVIGMATFQTCVSLESVVALDRITAIEANAFNGCRSLASLTLPGGLQSIGEAAFLNCCGLQTVYYGGNRAEWERVEIDPNSNDNILWIVPVFDGE